MTKLTATVGVFAACCALLLSGCGGSDTESTATTGTEPSTSTTATGTLSVTTLPLGEPAAQPLFAIAEVGLGPNGYVTLLNFTEEPQALSRHTLCQGSDCVDLPDTVVSAGGRARIAVGSGEGLSDVVLSNAAIGELETSDGEIAVYTEEESGGRRLVTFMEWGSTPHDHTEEAIENGLWLEGSFAPTADNAIRLYTTPGGLWVFDTA